MPLLVTMLYFTSLQKQVCIQVYSIQYFPRYSTTPPNRHRGTYHLTMPISNLRTPSTKATPPPAESDCSGLASQVAISFVHLRLKWTRSEIHLALSCLSRKVTYQITRSEPSFPHSSFLIPPRTLQLQHTRARAQAQAQAQAQYIIDTARPHR